ncbi:MAG: hypothetical protein HY899_05020 [Deltaproteobacteria bacterium]|nr:hypothetical protein [Deltaproteobacteria bacterium]
MQALRMVRIVAVSAALLVACSTGSANALLGSQEAKCANALARSFAKFESTILKETSKCHNDDISGKVDSPSACSTLRAASQEKIDAARAKLVSSAAKSCQSVCSLSNDKICVNDLGCPPNDGKFERCTGKGGTAPFRIESLGFPGAYCQGLLGHSMREPNDTGECVSELADRLASNLVDNLYGDLDENSGLSADAAKCLSSISKAAAKSVAKIHGAVAKCRNVQQTNPSCVGGTHEGEKCRKSADCGSGGICGIEPEACLLSDATTIAAVGKEVTKLSDAIGKSCSDAVIATLPSLCSGGAAAPGNVAEAKACVSALVKEVAASVEGPSRRVYSPYSMVTATNPDAGFAYCGDGIVNQIRNESNSIGEECDGDDAPCGSGHCLPPGDLFECTCDNVPREAVVIDGERVDSDAGWTGASHDAVHNDGFGFVADLSNCNCSDFNQATCVGTSSDSVCDETASRAPRCSNATDSNLTCDERGDNDGSLENGDCFACDADSGNAGAYCGDGNGKPLESLCQSRCFDDTTGLPVGTCTSQSGCADGQTCKGRCDGTATCKTITEGSPLPLVSAATTVCVQLQYVTDISGTKDMVSGEAVLHYGTRSVIYLGETVTSPCPTCGGVCAGGDNDRHPCSGRCNASHAICLVDGDCSGVGDTSCEQAADDCTGGYCSLDLRCSSGDNAGGICRPMSNTPLGVVSADCPPAASKNLSGFGVDQDYGDVTTEQVQFPAGSACSEPAWHNYTCPCPDGGSTVKTQPNRCAAACDAGINEGKGCALTGTASGVFTTCAGGSDAGALCDEDADCEGGTCSSTPTECVAGSPAKLGQSCSGNAQCDSSAGSGDGVCENSCPGGRCVPLCYPEGTCSGGTHDGDACATDVHCGGGTCVVTNAEDGVCAAGPLQYRCSGAGFTTLPCYAADVDTQTGCEAGGDGALGTTDDIPGAGICKSRPADCYYNNGLMEGGDTGNGDGDPSNIKYVASFCTGPAPNAIINQVSGFGGPSKITRYGSAFVNVPVIP